MCLGAGDGARTYELNLLTNLRGITEHYISFWLMELEEIVGCCSKLTVSLRGDWVFT